MQIFLHLDDYVISWESNNPSDCVAQSFFGFEATIRALEGLMDFLAFPIQKLRQNRQKLIRGLYTNSLGNSYKIRGISAITWAPETPGSQSRPLQLHIPAYNTTKV